MNEAGALSWQPPGHLFNSTVQKVYGIKHAGTHSRAFGQFLSQKRKMRLGVESMGVTEMAAIVKINKIA